jgi:hypothetical protein
MLHQLDGGDQLAPPHFASAFHSSHSINQSPKPKPLECKEWRKNTSVFKSSSLILSKTLWAVTSQPANKSSAMKNGPNKQNKKNSPNISLLPIFNPSKN